MMAGRYFAPEHYLHGGVVIVPERVAAFLLRYAGLGRLSSQVRGADAEVDAVLVALGTAGQQWRTSVTGSEVAPVSEVVARSGWLSSTQAGEQLGVTSRAVLLAISEQRLQAEKVDGRWRLNREDVEHYAAARRAA